jgi:phosphoketolase
VAGHLQRDPLAARISSLNLLITSTVWRQDHNGFTHQDPGFLDVVVNKNPEVARIYLPPDVNCLLSVVDHCLRSMNYINVIVADKQNHLQYLDMDEAIKHCTKGIGIWDWASNDEGTNPMWCGRLRRHPHQGGPGATAMLREEFDDIKIRFINVVDLFKLTTPGHPHALSRDFDSHVHQGPAGHLQLPRLPLADPPAHLPPPTTASSTCAATRSGQHQHAAGAGHRQRDRPLQPRHRRHRPRA